MKKTNLYEIKEMAKRAGRALYSIQQLANLINKPKTIAKVYSTRLTKKGLAEKVLRGKISFTSDNFVIASQLIEPSYISLFSALLFHQLIKQVPKNVQCVTTTNSREYNSLGIKYYKIPSRLFYGYKKYKKDFSYIIVADPEKAIIDAIYLDTTSKDVVKEIYNDLDKKKLNEYLERFYGWGKKKISEWLK
ncbi:MAG: hypothetical protein AB1391_00440 [Candidatus Micrarchaeota archaeon]